MNISDELDLITKIVEEIEPDELWKIVRLPAVIKMTGLSQSSIYQRCSDKTFPQRIRLGSHSVGWILAEVKAFIKALMLNLDDESVQQLVSNLVATRPIPSLENKSLADIMGCRSDTLVRKCGINKRRCFETSFYSRSKKKEASGVAAPKASENTKAVHVFKGHSNGLKNVTQTDLLAESTTLMARR